MSSPVWKGNLTIGELSIAVRLFSGPDAQTPGLKQIHIGCGSPVGQQSYCKGTLLAVKANEVGKAGEFDGRLIPLTAEHLSTIAPAKYATLPLILIPNDAVDSLFHESTYFLHPDGTSEPDYASLYELLKAERCHAITKLVLQRERWLLIRPGARGLIAHTLYFGIEARALNEFRTEPAPMDRRRLLYAAAIQAKGSFDPSTTQDEYPGKLHQLVKQLAEPPVTQPLPEPKPRSRRTPKAA